MGAEKQCMSGDTGKSMIYSIYTGIIMYGRSMMKGI
jgi:hypothetical protein